MTTRVEETDRFDAVSDSGRELTIIEYTTFKAFRPLSGTQQWVKGLRELVASNGEHVNFVDNDTVKDLDGIIYKRV